MIKAPNKYSLTSLLFGLAIAATAGTVISVLNVEPTKIDPAWQQAIRTGDYKDLTWYRKVKLGTAPYVNPGLVEETAVIYKFEEAQVRELKTRVDELLKASQDGSIGVAYPSTRGDYKVVRLTDADFEAVMSGAQLRDAFYLVSTHDTVLGVEADGALVTWKAGLAINNE